MSVGFWWGRATPIFEYYCLLCIVAPALFTAGILESVHILPVLGFWKKFSSLPIWAYTIIMWVCWLGMSLALLGSPRDSVSGNTQIVDSWGAIERVSLWQNEISWLVPRFELSQSVIAWSIRIAFAVLFLLQAGAFFSARSRSDAVLWPWLIGPIGAYLIMALLMPPANSDVFYYSMSASLAAEGVNPYTHNLQDFPSHPLLPYNHWIDIGSVYGPVWTWTGRTILLITGPDPIWAITGYRVLMGAVSIAMTLTTYKIGRLLTANKSFAVAAAVLVAWQPNMVFETIGQVHNDAFVILFALLAILVVLSGGMAALRGGVVLAAFSSATKFVTLPLLGLLLLLRFKNVLEDSANRARHVRNLLLDILAIMLVYFVTFGLFWVGSATIQEMLAEPSRLFAHPFWRIVEWIVASLGNSTTVSISNWTIRILMMLITLATFAWAALRTMGWYSKPDMEYRTQSSNIALPMAHYLLFTLLIVELTLSLVPANAHPWYQVWSVPFVAFWVLYTRTDRWQKYVGWYIALIAVFTITYHTRLLG